MKIKIEKGIPVPNKNLKIQYPFDEMEVVDSFFIDSNNMDINKLQIKIATKATYYKSRINNKVKFTCKKVDNGVRCWRIL